MKTRKLKDLKDRIIGHFKPSRNLLTYASQIARSPNYLKLCHDRGITSRSKFFVCPTCAGSGKTRYSVGPYDTEEERCATCKGEKQLSRQQLLASQKKHLEEYRQKQLNYQKAVQVHRGICQKLNQEEIEFLQKYGI